MRTPVQFRFVALLVLAVLIFAGGLASTADAQLPWRPGFGVGSSPYSLGQVPVPPYFSLHPPVYYSAPIPRTYGYSPYAYPATVMTPELKPTAKMIINPYFKGEATEATQRTASQSKIIRNPFFENATVIPAANIRVIKGDARQ
jgi:hypothetical protein